MNESISKKLFESFKIPLYFIALIWVIHIAQVITGLDWADFGVYPRRIWGLKGIITSPLIHGDFGHLSANTLSLFILSSFIFYFYRSISLQVVLSIYLLSGISLWLFGRPVFHIGASGIIYGFVSFIFWNGIFRRNIKSIALALFVLIQFNGMFLGIFPTEKGISWDGHFLGALSGIFVSFIFKGSLEPNEKKINFTSSPDEDIEKTFFLPPDTFSKTKAERQREKDRENDDNNPWYSNSTWT